MFDFQSFWIYLHTSGNSGTETCWPGADLVIETFWRKIPKITNTKATATRATPERTRQISRWQEIHIYWTRICRKGRFERANLETYRLPWKPWSKPWSPTASLPPPPRTRARRATHPLQHQTKPWNQILMLLSRLFISLLVSIRHAPSRMSAPLVSTNHR